MNGRSIQHLKGKMMAGALALGLMTTGSAFAQSYGYGGYGQPQYGYGPAIPHEELEEIEHQGFRDGVEGARRDFINHRRPNVYNRDEYRNPRLGGILRHEYREGFEHGYDEGVHRFYYFAR